ncbi:MAG TPA: HEAT repeat domain-containing protein [Myxococcaceae bacterium]|nr:HEAT repeat domain-containing protein [Myxococcaceae bacterium]
MGFFDLFRGATDAEKALKLKPRVQQKYGEPITRQKAIEQLGELRVKESVEVLLHRFTFSVEPATTDLDEKERVLDLVGGFGELALEPVKSFLRRSDAGITWALRALGALVPEEEAIGVVVGELEYLGSGYTRTHEKKVLFMNALADKDDPRIAPVVLSMLEDPADDAKVLALQILGPRAYAPAREPIVALLHSDESARRVQTAALEALAQSGFEIGASDRPRVEPLLGDRFTLDGKGLVHAR